jgi:starch synthase
MPQPPTLALIPWGVALEDVLDPLGISLETFCNEFRGSWMFGYVEALQSIGVRTILFCFSNQITVPSKHTHLPTGATIWLLPVSRTFHMLRPHVVYPYGQNVKHMFGEIHNVRKILLPFFYLLQQTLLYLATPHRLLAELISAEGCHVILCQEYEYPRFDACVVLGKVLRKPVFATFQGGTYHHSDLERFIRAYSIRACAGLIIASQAEIQRVHWKYNVPFTKVTQIFNPLNLQTWVAIDREEARVSFGIPEDARVVAWHGRISIHKKGLDILLNAWEQICREHPTQDLRLLLIGTGDGDAELSQWLRDRSLPGIVWIDHFIHDPQILRQYLSTADVYAFASRYEGFPVALIEAMACGLPIVATDTDGVRDILAGGESDGGLLVPQNNLDSFVLALNRVLNDAALRRKLSTAARRRVEMSCSFEIVGQHLRSFLFQHEKEFLQ